MIWLDLIDKPFLYRGRRFSNGKELLQEDIADQIIELEILDEPKYYEFTIASYMLRPPTIGFDFHARYNSGTYPRFSMLKGSIVERKDNLINIDTPSWKGWLPENAISIKEMK